MFETTRTALPNLDEYLERLGLPCAKSPSSEYLDELIYAHQCSIPFEDLDVYERHLEPALDVESLFDKMVVRKRGGYCFELNALFHALLEELGFDVRPCMARLTLRGDVHPMISHRAELVAFGSERYVADVGFGGPSPGFAMRLEDGFTREEHGQKFTLRAYDDHWFDLIYIDRDGREHDTIRICSMPAEEQDFEILSFYQSQNPQSAFRCNRIIGIRTPQGSRGIRNMMYTEHVDGVKTVRELHDAVDLDTVLSEKFGIENWR